MPKKLGLEDLILIWKGFKAEGRTQVKEGELKFRLAKVYGISDYTLKNCIKRLIEFEMITPVGNGIYELNESGLK